MTRPSSELRDEVRLSIVRRALGGEVISGWWQPNWAPARAHAVSGAGGWMDRDSQGERRSDGVHVWFASHGRRYQGHPASVHEANFEQRVRKPDVIVTWAEIREIVLAGATQDRRARYNEAYRLYCEHAAKPLPHPILRPGQRREMGLPPEDDSGPHPDNEVHWAEGLKIHRELAAAGLDILSSGVELLAEREAAKPVQLGLW